MVTSVKQSDYVKTALRLPPDVHAKLHASAAENGRSYNAEILARLQASLDGKPNIMWFGSDGQAKSPRDLIEASRAKEKAKELTLHAYAIAQHFGIVSGLLQGPGPAVEGVPGDAPAPTGLKGWTTDRSEWPPVPDDPQELQNLAEQRELEAKRLRHTYLANNARAAAHGAVAEALGEIDDSKPANAAEPPFKAKSRRRKL